MNLSQKPDAGLKKDRDIYETSTRVLESNSSLDQTRLVCEYLSTCDSPKIDQRPSLWYAATSQTLFLPSGTNMATTGQTWNMILRQNCIPN